MSTTRHKSVCVSASRAVRALLLGCAMALSACGGSGGGDEGGDTGDVTEPGTGSGNAGNAGSGVTVTGKASYEFPPPAANCNGLNFDNLQLMPIRQATIQLIDAATDAVLDETVTDDNGHYSLMVDAKSNVALRIRAELKKESGPSWDVEVRDNTSSTTLELGSRPIYVLDGSDFNVGTTDMTRDVRASTGWGGSSYTAARSAAPFAILDAVYNSMLLVLSEAPSAAFEPLDVFWSVNNAPTSGDQDIAAGDLGSSFYRSGVRQLFLLGKDGVDTEEFDDHVIVHEWGHYFEDTMSRSDSIGGGHSIGDLLDKRVAFGEGFATAFSGMALDSPQYCDTLWSGGQLRGFRIDIEGQPSGTAGWFNEVSAMKVIYDLWDTDPDGADNSSLGYGPIHSVMTGAQAATPAFTSIFSFAAALKAENPGQEAFINGLLQVENIKAVGIDAFGSGEINDGEPGSPDVLPVYTDVVPDGSAINICSNSQFDRDSSGLLSADGNKLSEYRYLRMNVGTAVPYTFSVVTTTEMAPDDPDNDRDQSDPDILIVRNGEVQNATVDGSLQGFSGVDNEEIFTTPGPLAAGEYVMALTEFRYQDSESPEDYPEQTCFEVSVTPEF